MLTIKAMVKKDGMRVDRKYNVKLSFTYKRKVSTDIKRKVDKLVESYRNKCDQLQVDANNYSLDEIMEMLKADEERQKPVDFIDFCQWWITTTTIKGKKNCLFL